MPKLDKMHNIVDVVTQGIVSPEQSCVFLRTMTIHPLIKGAKGHTGCLVSDDNRNRTFIPQIYSDPDKLLKFISEVMMRSNAIISEIFKQAYLRRSPITVNGEEVPWINYQAFFSNYTYYKSPEAPAKILALPDLEKNHPISGGIQNGSDAST